MKAVIIEHNNKREPGCLMSTIFLVGSIIKMAVEIFMLWQALQMFMSGDIDRTIAYLGAWGIVSLAHDYSSSRMKEVFNI